MMNATPFDYLRTTDGIRLRYGHWPVRRAKCRGTAVVLSGRSEFIEKYLETIHDLMDRGFSVFSLDWRGQGLSQRLLAETEKGYVRSYDEYLLDVDRLLDIVSMRQTRRPLIVLAHSMGANILLQCLHRHCGRIDRAVLLSPMVDIGTEPIPKYFAIQCSRLFVKTGLGHLAVPRVRPNDSFGCTFHRNRLTHDRDRFCHVQRLVQENSRFLVPSITFAWLAATFEAIARLSRPGFFRSITTPVLVVAAGGDRIVSNEAIGNMAAQLPNATLISIAGAYHEILQEHDGVRDIFWQAFERFVGC